MPYEEKWPVTPATALFMKQVAVTTVAHCCYQRVYGHQAG